VDPWIVIPGLAIIALGFVVLPIALITLAEFRRPRRLQCPETHTEAEVRVDAGHAALTAILGRTDVCVAGCSFWPERQACVQRCVAPAAPVLWTPAIRSAD
jgi:hypothetical protein